MGDDAGVKDRGFAWARNLISSEKSRERVKRTLLGFRLQPTATR